MSYYIYFSNKISNIRNGNRIFIKVFVLTDYILAVHMKGMLRSIENGRTQQYWERWWLNYKQLSSISQPMK